MYAQAQVAKGHMLEAKKELLKAAKEANLDDDIPKEDLHERAGYLFETWYLWWPMINRYHRV